MPETLGTRLRRRREERNVELGTIAQRTKIKLSLLQALERDDVSQWPAGIFRRAYVRAYAQAIGLEPDAVVREFLEAHPDPADVVETEAADGSGSTGKEPPSAGMRFRSIVGSAWGSFSRVRRDALATAQDRGRAPVLDVERAVTPEVPTLSAARPPAPREPDPEPEPEPAPATAPKRPAAAPMPSVDLDLLAVARLCTELGKVEHGSEVPPLLREAARILDAKGLIVWIWDSVAAQLRPAVAHGYSERMLAQLPGLPPEADNATAAAFRTSQTCAISGDDHSSGAVAVPLLTPAGCVGVLAIELPHGSERSNQVRAVAMILAAALAQLTGGTQTVDAPQEADATAHAN